MDTGHQWPKPKLPGIETAAQKDREFQVEIDELQKRIGYTFKDRGLLVQAMTSKDFALLHTPHIPHNKELEIEGDKLLDVYINDMLRRVVGSSKMEYKDAPYHDMLRTNIFLSLTGLRLRLDQVVRVSTARVHATKTIHEHVDNDREDGEAITKARLTADSLEALVAAIHHDGGAHKSREFVEREIFSNGQPDEQAKSIIALCSEDPPTVAAAFNRMTFGRGHLYSREWQGKYIITASYRGQKMLAVADSDLVRGFQSLVTRFFMDKPWAFWGYDGPISLIMPRASNYPYAGAAVTEKIVVSNREDADWPPLILPAVQNSSTPRRGPFIDQLRLEYKEQGEVIVRSPNAKAKHNKKFAFYIQGPDGTTTHLMTVTGMESLQDGAREVLNQKRKRNGNGK